MTHTNVIDLYKDVSDLIPDLLFCIKNTDMDNVRQFSGSIYPLPTYYKRARLLTAKFIKERKDGSFYVTLIGKEVAESFSRNKNRDINFIEKLIEYNKDKTKL